ncbi:MAG: translocation/assembly module TamB domain-containing protein, partial [Bacillota bacterium]
VSTVTDLLVEQGLEYDLPDIKGRASFQGELGQTLENPRLELSLGLAEASIQGNKFQGFQALIVYNDRLLQIDSLTADSENFQLSGSGLLDLQGEAPEVEGDLSLSNLEYDYLDRFVEPQLPLKGSLNLDLEIAGNPRSPQIEGTINSFETTLDLPRRSFEVNTFKLVFKWHSEQLLAIKQLELTRDQSRLTASGGIKGKQLDLEVGLDNLNLYELGLVPHLTGDLDLEARIKGAFEDPQVSGSLVASDLFYRDHSLDRLEGDFQYSSGKLELPGARWSLNQGQYRLSGAIRQLPDQPELDLRLAAEQSQLKDFFRFVDARPADLPFDLDYQLTGGIRLLGPVASPETRIDLKLINQENKGNLVEFKGKMAEQLEVNITGKEFAIKEFMGDNLPSEVEGKASFYGILAGTVSNPRLELETAVEHVEINSHQLKDIRGQLRYYHENRLLTVKQDLTLPDQRALRLAGGYRFNPGRIQELQLNADRFPVEILAGAAPGLKELEGHIDGQAGLTGTLDNPHLEGNLSFKLDTMDLGLHRQFNNLNGELMMEDRKIVLNDTGGYFGGKAFRLTGKIKPFSREEFWGLGFDGEELAFNRGDYQGRLDARLRMTGPLFQPLFSGELKAHQFQVSPPFEWPEGEDGESRFKPRLDLTVVPGEEVFIQDENLEIPVEEGSLRLLLADDNFDIEGTLSTGRGNFSYYNTRFLIERARAEFQRFEDNIPEVQGEAWTVVSGTRINLNVTGPADNMVLTLSSNPEMSEDEILNLLASRGGLGSLIFGDSEGMGSVIKQEAQRFLQRIFQVDIIGGLETGFRKALELDRVEIDTYDLGQEEEITIHLGKDLTDRLSMDFSATFGDGDGNQEFSFRYFLDEKTYLEGGWYGEDDFRMSIETNIPF